MTSVEFGRGAFWSRQRRFATSVTVSVSLLKSYSLPGLEAGILALGAWIVPSRPETEKTRISGLVTATTSCTGGSWVVGVCWVSPVELSAYSGRDELMFPRIR